MVESARNAIQSRVTQPERMALARGAEHEPVYRRSDGTTRLRPPMARIGVHFPRNHRAAGRCPSWFRNLIRALSTRIVSQSPWPNQIMVGLRIAYARNPARDRPRSMHGRIRHASGPTDALDQHTVRFFANTTRRRFPETSELLSQYQVERALNVLESQREAAEAALRCTLSFVQFTALDVIEERQWIDLAQRLADTGISKEIRHHARQISRRIRQSQSPDTPKA